MLQIISWLASCRTSDGLLQLLLVDTTRLYTAVLRLPTAPSSDHTFALSRGQVPALVPKPVPETVERPIARMPTSPVLTFSMLMVDICVHRNWSAFMRRARPRDGSSQLCEGLPQVSSRSRKISSDLQNCMQSATLASDPRSRRQLTLKRPAVQGPAATHTVGCNPARAVLPALQIGQGSRADWRAKAQLPCAYPWPIFRTVGVSSVVAM